MRYSVVATQQGHSTEIVNISLKFFCECYFFYRYNVVFFSAKCMLTLGVRTQKEWPHLELPSTSRISSRIHALRYSTPFVVTMERMI